MTFPNTRDFKAHDFLCGCGVCNWSRDVSGILSPDLVKRLQQLKDLCTYFNEERDFKIKIISGVRCPEYDRDYSRRPNVQGTIDNDRNSPHIRGLAADIWVENVNIFLWSVNTLDNMQYVEVHDDYIHVDIYRRRRDKFNDFRG